jgi:zinc/manganese transport system substrate-binding protein
MKRLVLIIGVLLSSQAFASLKVFTTTTNLADLVRQIGGELVTVESLCKGTQDPHFLEAKPSYTFKLSRADLLVSVGASLEEGWLPLVIRGSRNPKLREGQAGHFEAAEFVKMLEVKQEVTRAQGDVHPEGNPHFMLSPVRALDVAKGLKDKLIELDSANKVIYEKNFQSLTTRWNKKIAQWKLMIKEGMKVISYHKTLTYFYHDFAINNVDVLEPKPGIPPTASHIIKVINEIKDFNVEKIIVENYFDDAVAKKVKRSMPKVQVHKVPVAVDGAKGVNNLDNLYDYLIKVMGQ